MILINGGVVAYYSGRLSTVALCTTMAESIALAKLVVKFKHNTVRSAVQTRAGDNNQQHLCVV
jgi:hypothetical protein